jgi:hypothetical protein
VDRFDVLVPGARGWNLLDNGFSRGSAGFNGLEGFLSATMADVNGDGLRDILQVQEVLDVDKEWRLWQNVGNAQTDQFSADLRPDILTAFEDTTIDRFSPSLGDLTEDGIAELACIEQSGYLSVIAFYTNISSEGLLPLEGFQAGLPEAPEALHLTDIDGDGRAELFIRHDDIHWSVYFFRNARWQDYSDILPEFESTDIGFADFDNDGDLDIFTDEDVWLSLSPSPASENFILSPSSFILSAYPNPFNATTTIRFDLPIASHVVLDVYNIAGQKVQSITDKPYTAGTYALEFDGSSLASGLYFARLQSDQQIKTTKLMLVK